MRSLISHLANSNIGITFRNLIGLKPVQFSFYAINGSVSVSDAFCWRTDNEFKTIFNFSNILELYYKIKNSYIEIIFYNKNNDYIKKININSLKLTNTLLIDNEFMDGINDYGVFYVFHRFDENIDNDIIIANRCYTGFSYKNNMNSFVHGNSYSRYRNIKDGSQYSNIVKTSFFVNQIYNIQNCFKNMTKSELFFANPTSKKITYYINNIRYNLNVGCSEIIDITSADEITILSNCCYLRPIVFNYKGDYIDVYHG